MNVLEAVFTTVLNMSITASFKEFISRIKNLYSI